MASTTRHLGACAAAILILAGCGRQPLGPTSVTGVEAGPGGLSAKPSASTPHSLSLSGGVTGSGIVQGTIAGVDGGTLRAQVSGSYSLQIVRSALQGNGTCEGEVDSLAAHGLFDTALDGSVSFEASEKTSTGDRVVARLTGVERPDGTSWDVSVDSVGYPVTISGSTTGVTASVPFTVIGFKQIARGRSFPIVRCAVAFTATVTPA